MEKKLREEHNHEESEYDLTEEDVQRCFVEGVSSSIFGLRQDGSTISVSRFEVTDPNFL
jgi:hypothetical protein